MVRTHKAGARLEAHHGSSAGTLPASQMAWSLNKQQQETLAAMAAFFSGSKGSGKGASGGPPRGKKDGIPNWNCKCGHTENWGTRPVCKRCGAEAPKRILKLQAEKGTTPPPPPRNPGTGPGASKGGSPTPAGTPSNPPGASAGSGEWRNPGKGGRHTPEPAQASDNDAEAGLRKQLEAAKDTLRTAKSKGTDEETTEFLQRRVDRLQADLDALKPLDARFRSLLDQKTAAEGRVASTETKVAKAKEALKEAEAEETAARAKLADVNGQIEELRQQQQKEAEANAPPELIPQPGDELVRKLSENGLPEAARQSFLTTLGHMGITAAMAADRGLLLAKATLGPTQPKQGQPNGSKGGGSAKEAAWTATPIDQTLPKGASQTEVQARRKRHADAMAALESLDHAHSAEKAANADLARLRAAEAEAQAKVTDATEEDPPEMVALVNAVEAVAEAERKRQRLAQNRAKAEARAAEVSRGVQPAPMTD